MRYEYISAKPSFTVKGIGILNITRPQNYRHSYRTGRTKHGFIYTVRGAILDVFLGGNAESITASAGDLIFIPKNCAYVATYLENDTELKIVQFDLSDGTLPDYLSKPTKIDLRGAEEYINAFFRPPAVSAAGHPFYDLSCLYRLLWQIDDHYARLPQKYKKLQAAITTLSAHYGKNMPVAYYAELCSMSEVSFRRLFREYTGMSPVDYRNDLRLKSAKAMIESGEYNVTEAAEASGFSNLSFFIRLYKKKYGHTPKKE